MLTVSNLSLQFGKRILFNEVNIKFTKGNCYGIIGANGSGKSTFLKILSGKQDPTTGSISLDQDKRISFLEQNHFIYDKFSVLETVLIGNKKMFSIKKELDNLYAKPNFSDEDGIQAAHLETLFDEMGGWYAENNAATLLSNLGIYENKHSKSMYEVSNKDKVRVLLAQALFGDPDVLILDEPTNDLDVYTIEWLEKFLAEYKNTVIIVSHDRHFLDAICTHICDLDYAKLNLFTGNYSFWHEASQLLAKQKVQQNKKVEDKRKELQEFIQRFSSNVAKAKQATARKKMLSNLNLEDIQPSSRRYPAIIFEQEREAGDQILAVKNLVKKNKNNNLLFSNINLDLKKKDKIAILSKSTLAISEFFEIISGKSKQNDGTYFWGVTTKQSYLPLDYQDYFNIDVNLIDWLRQYVIHEEERNEQNIRSFLGKMLFSGEEALKSCTILSGGEKMRCMFSRMMLMKANVLILNNPTNHLDLETITALNNALCNFKGTILLSSHDHQLLQTTCNRIIELAPQGCIDRYMKYDEYNYDTKVKKLREELYQ